MMLLKGYKTVVDWFQEVASDPGYANPAFAIFDEIDEEEEVDAPGADLKGVEVEKVE
jgi:hypothetical protein